MAMENLRPTVERGVTGVVTDDFDKLTVFVWLGDVLPIVVVWKTVCKYAMVVIFNVTILY